MRAIIFAGGVGTRLWPLSRKKSPKQFEHVIGDRSTLQLTVERLIPEFDTKDIYISTGIKYVDMVRAQLPMLPPDNVIGEPVKKDVGPAVAYAVGYVSKNGQGDEPVVILWSDHLVKNQDKFKQALQAAETVVKNEPNKIVFIGQKPRFASDNLGWIHYDAKAKSQDNINFYAFGGFKYRPGKDVATKYFEDNQHCWNLGYFVTTPSNLLSLFQTYVPDIYTHLQTILDHKGKPDFDKVLSAEYDAMPVINFDNALLEKLTADRAYVVVEDIGWSDIGAWEALKEALEKSPDDNVTHGRMLVEDSKDNLIYNYEDSKLIVAIDLENLLVVNTQDVLLVASKSSVPKIKKLVENFEGTENENLT